MSNVIQLPANLPTGAAAFPLETRGAGFGNLNADDATRIERRRFFWSSPVWSLSPPCRPRLPKGSVSPLF